MSLVIDNIDPASGDEVARLGEIKFKCTSANGDLLALFISISFGPFFPMETALRYIVGDPTTLDFPYPYDQSSLTPAVEGPSEVAYVTLRRRNGWPSPPVMLINMADENGVGV